MRWEGRWGSFARGLGRALFVLYCLEAGFFLVMIPWRDFWPRLLTSVPLDGLRIWLESSLGRGAVTGFGLIHLVWGVHDLHGILSGVRRSRPSAGEEPTS